MKIAKIESLHADAGTRNFGFLKLTTDTGLVDPRLGRQVGARST